MTWGHWEDPSPELSELWVPAGPAMGIAAMLVYRGRVFFLLAQWFSIGAIWPLPTYQPGILSGIRRAMSQLQKWCYWHQRVEDLNIYNAQDNLHHKLTWSKVPTKLRWRNSDPRREFRWARTIPARYTFSEHMSIHVNPGRGILSPLSSIFFPQISFFNWKIKHFTSLEAWSLRYCLTLALTPRSQF